MHLVSLSILSAALLWLPVAHAQVSPIIAGTPPAHHEAVVGLGMDLGERRFIACTGTLITPRLVLTAAHCDGNLSLDLVIEHASAYFGRSADDVDEVIGFTRGWIHPDNKGLEYDFGLVELERDADVDPTAIWQKTIDEALLDAEVEVVGWGEDGTGAATGGVKRSTTLTIDRISEMYLISYSETNPGEALPCDGDSGGPLYAWLEDRRVQVGVHSWGLDPCRERSGSSRVDQGLEWIETVVAEVHGSDDICEANDRYGDGVCDRACPEPDSDCPDASETKSCACSSSPGWLGGAWVSLGLLGVVLRRRQ